MPMGTATLDFGVAPGNTDATVAVTGQTAVSGSSYLEAYVALTATADHSADEHWVENLAVAAGNVVAGTGFTIYGKTTDSTRLTGRWTIGWVWV